jgi:hypothetical protein
MANEKPMFDDPDSADGIDPFNPFPEPVTVSHY